MDPRNVPDDAYIAVMRRYYEIAKANQRDPTEGIHVGDFEQAVLEIAAIREKNKDPNK